MSELKLKTAAADYLIDLASDVQSLSAFVARQDADCALRYLQTIETSVPDPVCDGWNIVSTTSAFEHMASRQQNVTDANCFVVTIAHEGSKEVDQLLFMKKGASDKLSESKIGAEIAIKLGVVRS